MDPKELSRDPMTYERLPKKINGGMKPNKEKILARFWSKALRECKRNEKRLTESRLKGITDRNGDMIQHDELIMYDKEHRDAENV